MMRVARYLMTMLALVAVSGMATGARAASASEYCRRVGTDDVLRPIDASLIQAVVKQFELGTMPAEQVIRSTYFRCANGRVLVCSAGANLPCGKADTRRTLPGTSAWCAHHPGSAFIPLAVTGHATIYQWRCNGPSAAIIRTPAKVDERGFISQYWKRLDAD
jgi:hypothetical protein